MNYNTYCLGCGQPMSSLAKCKSCGADYYGANDIDPPKNTIPTPFTKDSNTYSNNASIKEIDFSKFISASELESMISSQIKGIVSENL